MHEADAAIMRIAEQRSRVITRSILREELGLTDPQIDRRVGRLLHPLHPGAYVVGSAASTPTLNQLAVGACLTNASAHLSGPTAASWWGLRRTPRDLLEVTILTGTKLCLPRARVRQTSVVLHDEIVEHGSGVRISSPALTLFEMASQTDRWALRSMAEDALNKELTSVERLAGLADRICRRGRNGSAPFAELAGRNPMEPPVGSEDELVLAEALAATGIPMLRQHRVHLPGIGWSFLDLFQPDSLLDVEIDHSHWHAGLVEVHRDKSRDLQVRRLGIEPVRLTEIHVHDHLDSTVAIIAELHVQRLRERQARAG